MRTIPIKVASNKKYSREFEEKKIVVCIYCSLDNFCIFTLQVSCA
jgi:hypothetical protein